MTVERIRQSDWVRQWRASQQPMLLARRIHLQPPGQKSKPPPGSIALIIDPGMAFGTGRHETTQLCLWGLVERLRHGMRVLDLGCGSGILALSAAKLGAGQVFALDLDPVAVQCARKNAALNGLSDRVAIICASLSSLLNSPSRFDLAMINITASIIQQFLREDLKRIFRPGGMAIFSGILAAEMQTLTSDLQKAGFDIIQERALGEWCSLAVRVGL